MSNLAEHGSATHGTISSYVIGFVLSLVFTLIPYFLVVNQLLNSMTLFVTILGFALLQLVVQVFFFLHLGRGPKPKWNLYFFIGTIGTILIVVAGSIIITNNLHYNMASTDQTKRLINSEGIYQVGGELTGACKGQNTNHRVTFKDGAIEPMVTVASKCDTITFVQDDGEAMNITFGTHDRHDIYAGQKELILKKGRSKSINLSELGTYQFHDHDRPKVIGTFAVYDN